MTDFYDEAGEYIDLLIASFWDHVGDRVAEALRPARGVPGAVLDIGAGSGFGTIRAAAALPEAPVVALEPSRVLRAVLLAKVAERAELRDRVTVVDADLDTAEVPDKLAAVLAMNVIGHFDVDSRRRLWSTVDARLAPGGVVVLNLAPPETPREVPESEVTEVRVGRRRYVGSARATVAGPDSVAWTMTYRTYEGTELVRERVATSGWWVLGEDALRAEVAEHGLTLTGGPELHVITRGGSRPGSGS